MAKANRKTLCAFILLLVLAACSAPTSPTPPPASPTARLAVNTSAPPPTSAASQLTVTPTGPAAILLTGAPAPHLPAGALSIVALGDSLTQGDGDESGQDGYPSRLAELITTLRPDSQMLNLGKSGWSSADLVNGVNGEPATLPQALSARPNLALVWIGSNDLWYLYEYGPEPMTAEAEQQDLNNYAANLDTLLGPLTSSGAAVFIALLDDQSKRPVVANPPNPSEPAFSAITPEDLARMSKHVIALNTIIAEKAARYGALTVDFYNTHIFTDPATLYSDGNHPNTTGYEKITAIWYSAIEPSLK